MSLKDWYCSRCSLQFDKKIIYDMHLSIVHKESVKIKEEPLTCENETNLGSEKALFMCEFCDSEFETEIILNQHILSYHKENKPFKCDICDYRCSRRSNLKRHVESVHEKKNHSNVSFVSTAVLKNLT